MINAVRKQAFSTELLTPSIALHGDAATSEQSSWSLVQAMSSNAIYCYFANPPPQPDNHRLRPAMRHRVRMFRDHRALVGGRVTASPILVS
jgi:hypothetical protein